MGDYENFTGGSLKLKGFGVQKKKKSKKSKESIEKALEAPPEKKEVQSSGRTLTPAELRFEETRKKRQEEKAAKIAQKSHKERVADFNNYLASLSEHHDIPKVGPG
ncbi:hypothetical protein BC829DRAFT_406955 [Chytridium lagenaria]|nr:hypothetical protein BC829DRAFT_406955 [Chytridium lagenaria]